MLMVADARGRGVSGMLTSALVLKNPKCDKLSDMVNKNKKGQTGQNMDKLLSIHNNK